jgi:LemA protein
MSVAGFIFWGVIAVAVIYLIAIYNGLVTLKHNVSKA